MKRIAFIPALMAMMVAFSCNKNEVPADDSIVFHVEEKDMILTKATVVDNLNTSGFEVIATRGAAGSETVGWAAPNSTHFAGAPNFKGGRYWPSTNPSYHFYATNAAAADFSFAADGCRVNASNAVDVVCAYLPSPTYHETNLLTFEHIFARLGSVKVKAGEGYTISNVSIKITPKVSGVYNIRVGSTAPGANTDGGWSSTVSGTQTEIFNPSLTIAPGVSQQKANDIFLVPGLYSVTCTWTATKGDYTETFTRTDNNVLLEKGKVNNLTAKVKNEGGTPGGEGIMTGNAKEIEFTVTITPWGSVSKDMTFPVE